LDFPSRAKLALSGAEDGSQRNTATHCNSLDQSLAAGCILNRTLGVQGGNSGLHKGSANATPTMTRRIL
jgi:hypothetical protein